MKLLTNFKLNFDKLGSFPTKAVSAFDLTDYSVTIYYSDLDFDKFVSFSLKNFYTNQEVDFRLYDWKGLGFIIENKTLFVNNKEDIKQLFSILASTYNNISVINLALCIYCTNTINAKVSNKVKFTRVDFIPAGNIVTNSACDFGVADYNTLVTMIEVCYDTVVKNLQYYYVEDYTKKYRLDFSDIDEIKGLVSKYGFALKSKVTNGDVVKSMGLRQYP